ncbi:hypothetical protein Tco_0988386 [Tanacetum coccineum]|uniref:Uncharacterized protein n=1 Tax=Tanacetum coccineum TaxID=301880 RepID=A0ABQ5ERE6_9ASTR
MFSQDIRDQLNAEAEAVQIILTGIDNDIYSTVDACPNACEMWKAIERLKQGESINVQDLETNLYWSLKISHHRWSWPVHNFNFKQPEMAKQPSTVLKNDEMSKEKEIDKRMALISLRSRKSTNLPQQPSKELTEELGRSSRAVMLQGLGKYVAMENEHPEQPGSSNDIYLVEQGDTNITIDSLDICYDRAKGQDDMMKLMILIKN